MNELVVRDKGADWRRLKTLVLDSVSSPITKRGLQSRPRRVLHLVRPGAPARLHEGNCRREPMPVDHQHLARLKQRAVLNRHDVELLVIVVGTLRARNTCNRSLTVRLGQQISTPLGKNALALFWPRLQKAHAISIDMTTVLPLPVAIFAAMRRRATRPSMSGTLKA